MKHLFFICLLLGTSTAFTQTNVRAWYADGQVWVVWEFETPLPDWYAVHAKQSAFTSTADGVLVGKLSKFEYTCVALKEQVDTAETPSIPGPGAVKYQLKSNEALFVFTPHQAGALFFSVTADNETAVVAGQNITASAVQFQYDPTGDPVECHLQKIFPSPFASGFVCFAFLMWADGRQNQWENRPDFPVTANAAKNGMPSFFMISVPVGLDTTQPFALSVWLHGGGGTARQSLAGSRAEVNIKPVDGILLTHNDDLFGWRGMFPPGLENPSWHFGYRKNYDPFNSGNLPSAPDTIVNYTQRRYLWIDYWLIRHFNIDPSRIQIHGHSMGSAGALALAKCYPDHYASATIFNTGCGGPEPGGMLALFGDAPQNFPTNLKNRAGGTVHQLNLWNLLDNCSPSRDLPTIRHWHGKNDDNGTMRWDAYVVENFRKADSIGLGIQNMWSERAHGMDTAPGLNDHWIVGIPANQQTAVDNVDFAESRFRAYRSFPAFFNHRLDSNAHDPGTGLIGINNSDGDNWGTWGGYHRWENVQENSSGWQATAWLESNAVFANDNCPDNFLTADLAIRKPQQFKPAAGKTLHWSAKDMANGAVLQSGTATVRADGLVVLPQVVVFRENIRRVRIEVVDQTVATDEPAQGVLSNLAIMPNPGSAAAFLTVQAQKTVEAVVCASGLDGRPVCASVGLHTGENRVPLSVFENLPAGFYCISVQVDGTRQTVKWIKI
ncbi:MAG: alpha/beta hydrolase-fold protein [Saprospiraceae bacterium]